MYTKKNIHTELIRLGLRKGDIIICSTSFGMLGMPKFKVKDVDDISNTFFNILINIIGNTGTIFTPTYSYSFKSSNSKEKNIFNINLTKSKVGPFGEYIRKKQKSIRSIDPMVSIVGFGPDANILENQKHTSYGKGCVFENFLKIKKIKILNIGVGPNFLPFIHYVDFLNKCNHRYDKYFNGYIIKNNKKMLVKWHYPVPYLRKEAISDGHKIANHAMNKIIYQTKLGNGKIYISSYGKLFNYSLKLSKLDPWITAVGPKFR